MNDESSKYQAVEGTIVSGRANSFPGFILEVQADMGFAVGEPVWISRTAPASQPAEQPLYSERHDALCDSQYAAGMKFGWNMCVAGKEVEFNEIVASRSRAACAVLKYPAEQPRGEAVALGYAPGELDRTAPEVIYLQVDTAGDNDERDDPCTPQVIGWMLRDDQGGTYFDETCIWLDREDAKEAADEMMAPDGNVYTPFPVIDGSAALASPSAGAVVPEGIVVDRVDMGRGDERYIGTADGSMGVTVSSHGSLEHRLLFAIAEAMLAAAPEVGRG